MVKEKELENIKQSQMKEKEEDKQIQDSNKSQVQKNEEKPLEEKQKCGCMKRFIMVTSSFCNVWTKQYKNGSPGKATF